MDRAAGRRCCDPARLVQGIVSWLRPIRHGVTAARPAAPGSPADPSTPAASPPPRSSSRTAGRNVDDPRMTAGGRDRTRALSTGVYAQDHWSSGGFAADVGLRVDELHVSLQDGSTDDSVGISPRAGASYAFTKDTVVHAVHRDQLAAAGAARRGERGARARCRAARSAGDVRPQARDRRVRRARSRDPSRQPDPRGAGGMGEVRMDQLDDTAIGLARCRRPPRSRVG